MKVTLEKSSRGRNGEHHLSESEGQSQVGPGPGSKRARLEGCQAAMPGTGLRPDRGSLAAFADKRDTKLWIGRVLWWSREWGVPRQDICGLTEV